MDEMTNDRKIAEKREAAKALANPPPPPPPRPGGREVKHPNPTSQDASLVTHHGKKIEVTEEQFAEMLRKAGGFRTRVAKQLGVTVSAITHRIKRSKYLTDVCQTIDETVLDIAEAALLKAAQNGEPWAVTFILKCKGRKRGWIERQDMVFGSAESLPPPIVFGVHDQSFIDAERERQKKEFAEIVDVATVELTDDRTGTWSAESPSSPETSGATGPSLPQDAPDGADVATVAAQIPQDGPQEPQESVVEPAAVSEADAEPPQTGPGASTGDPRAAHGETPAPKADAPQAPQAPPAPRVPRTPSEAAAMRREREEAERRANGNAAGQAQVPQQPRIVLPMTFPRRG